MTERTPPAAGLGQRLAQLRHSRRLVRRLTLALVGLVGLQAGALALDALAPPDMTRGQQASPVALDRRGAWLRALPVENGRWRIRADLDRTDPAFVERLVAIEDARFWIHPGVDPLAVLRASGTALASGEVSSGASTLTMQTARLLEPRPRNLGAKLVEMVRAVQIEARLSKREILAMYLTLAPYGGNLEGVRAASLSYFGQEPSGLTPGQQALLIALPQAPEARRPDRRPDAARAARHAVLAKMVRSGVLCPGEAQEAADEPLPSRAPFPALAWHAAGELARGARSDQASVVSTLDAGLQTRLEPLVARAARVQGADASAAVMIVELDGRAVRASVGSPGLDKAGGWIDMTRALRSPGSALKPFIYGMAFERGIAAPDTRMADAPRRFADYQPENFDRVFHDQVTAREALTHSLNVPAVDTLARLGPAAFEARLQNAGVRLSRPKAEVRDPGLAIALGGVGVSLRDLAVLYGALADGGLARPLAWTEAAATEVRVGSGARLISREAAEQVVSILRETPPPAGVTPAALARGRPLMAYKTGTSYGFRDAVAAGIVGGHVIVVWTGRADGGARAGLTGRDAALPLLFEAAELLHAPPAAPQPLAPRAAPMALQSVAASGEGPRLIFPPDGAVVQVESYGAEARGLVLAAGGGEDLAWYVGGEPLSRDAVSGQVVWRPDSPGFYELSVVDPSGRAARARVRIRGG